MKWNGRILFVENNFFKNDEIPIIWFRIGLSLKGNGKNIDWIKKKGLYWMIIMFDHFIYIVLNKTVNNIKNIECLK